MKKYIILYLLFISLTAVCFAQSIHRNNLLQTGDLLTLRDLTPEGNSPGNQGQNIIWDFSQMIPANIHKVECVATQSTQYASDFPQSNLCLIMDSTIYSFLNYSSNEASLVGEVFYYFSNSIYRKYANSSLSLIFPFSFNSTFQDSFESEIDFIDSIHTIGKIVSIVDGKGILKTPSGIFENALRVKRTETEKDSSFDGKVSESQLIQYFWYSPDYKDLLFYYSIEEDFTSDKIDTIIKYNLHPEVLSTGSLNELNEKGNIKLFPNPAERSEEIHVEIPKLQTLEFIIYDNYGRLLSRKKLSGNEGDQFILVEKNELLPGFYFIFFETDKSRICKPVLIK